MQCRNGYVNHWEAQPPYIANYKFSSTEQKKAKSEISFKEYTKQKKKIFNQAEHSHSTSFAKVDTSSSSRFSIFENSHFETKKEEESTRSDIEHINIFSDFDETLSTASNSSQQRSSQTIFSVYENNHDVKMSLIDWAKEFNISHVALKNLLQLLKPILPELPSDPRTFLSTPRKYEIVKVGDGMYHHFGIAKTISTFLPHHFSNHTIFLKINIDDCLCSKVQKHNFGRFCVT